MSITPAQRAEISRRGGVAAHRTGKAHEFTSEEAREAGRLGGQKVSKDREHMRKLGRLGGLRRAANLKARQAQ